jgi:hypothetical protein
VSTFGDDVDPYGPVSGQNPVPPLAAGVNAVDVHTAADLDLTGALAAVWLAAGLLAEALPGARTARELRRRAAALTWVLGAGVAGLAAVPVLARVVPGPSAAQVAALLPAVPALLVVGTTLRRLTVLRSRAATFASAPMTPTPPALRAAAAHPLVAVPLQITGLAALLALPVAVSAGTEAVTGAAVMLAGLGAAAGARAVVRHSRLSQLVLAPLGRAPRLLRSGAADPLSAAADVSPPGRDAAAVAASG